MKSKEKLHGKAMFAAAVMAALLTGGCAGDRTIAAERIAGADKAVDTARATSAATDATVELKSAEDNLAQAKTAMERKEYEEAARLAESATADADLAQAKASSAKSKKATDQMRDTVRSLKRELDQMQSR